METKELTECDVQAAEFVEATEITIEKNYIGHSRRFGDTPTAQFDITIKRADKAPWTFAFNDSIANSYQIKDENHKMIPRWEKYGDCMGRYAGRKGFDETLRSGGGKWYSVEIKYLAITPTDYDLLACTDASCCETLQDFCDKHGLDDSVKAREIWLAVQDESAALRRIFSTEELEALQEIN